MKITTQKTRSGLVAIATLLTAGVLFAQDAFVESEPVLRSFPALELLSQKEVPEFGTFFLLSDLVQGFGAPPYPCIPPKATGAPIMSLSGLLIVDDSASNLSLFANLNPETTALAIESQLAPILTMRSAQVQRDSLLAMNTTSSMTPPGDWEPGDTNYTPTVQFISPVHTSNDLYLEINRNTNATTASLLIYPPWTITNGVYDLFSTTNLGSGAWRWELRTAPGQTNISITDLTLPAQMFILGLTNDTDGDGMSDAYERLVNHSNPAIYDSAIRSGFNQYTLPANDDGSTDLVPIGFAIQIFGNVESQLYVNNNGNVSFDVPLWQYVTTPLQSLGTKIIAPYWADVDTRGIGSAQTTYGYGTNDGHSAFGVNWVDVGYYGAHTDRRLSCQLIIIDRSEIASGDFDMEFNYARVEWEWGDASIGYPPRVGFSDGIETYEFPGSGISGAFVDSNLRTGLKHLSLNSWQRGRYIFHFRNGTGKILPPVEIDPPGSSSLPVQVTLAVSNHPNATIFYTLDGTTPTHSSLVYSGPLNLTNSTTLRTFAAESGWTDGQISVGYFMPPVPLIIVNQPQSQTVTLNSDATFDVEATGADPLSYQWIFDGNVVGIHSSLYIPHVQTTNAGDYHVIISDIFGNVVSSDHVTLTVENASSPPSVSILSPTNGADVSGEVAITAIGTDDVRTVRAKLFVDGNEFAALMYDSPYVFPIDTTALSNGSHEIRVRVYDIDNSDSISAPLQLNVTNFISNCKSSASAFTPNGASNTTITISAQFQSNADWILTITKANGSSSTSYSGTSNQLSFSWDGTGASGTGEYNWELEATQSGVQMAAAAGANTVNGSGSNSGGKRSKPKTLYIDMGAPNWENINNINYHAYYAQIFQYNYIFFLRQYFYTYLGAGPWLFQLPPSLFTEQARLWNTLLGYNGDIVVRFSAADGGDFNNYVLSDHVVYMLGHCAGSADQDITTMFDRADDNGTGFTGPAVRRWMRDSNNGYEFMFVQMNGCNSATRIDPDGNNDMAAGFGIFNKPFTAGRAYLGWHGYVIPGPGTLYTFDGTFWNHLYDGWTVADAAAEAFTHVPGILAHPVVVGDPNLVLPQKL